MLRAPRLAGLFTLLTLGTMLLARDGSAHTPADYYRATREPAMLQALGILEVSENPQTVKTIIDNDVKLVFKNMTEFGKQYATHDAISWITDHGEQIIYINAKHATAPPPALAAIISHEAMHADRENSLEEERVAWEQEARTWREMKQKYPDLEKIPNKMFPLVDRLNAILILEGRQQLAGQVKGNVAYRGLPEHSPGF